MSGVASLEPAVGAVATAALWTVLVYTVSTAIFLWFHRGSLPRLFQAAAGTVVVVAWLFSLWRLGEPVTFRDSRMEHRALITCMHSPLGTFFSHGTGRGHADCINAAQHLAVGYLTPPFAALAVASAAALLISSRLRRTGRSGQMRSPADDLQTS